PARAVPDGGGAAARLGRRLLHQLRRRRHRLLDQGLRLRRLRPVLRAPGAGPRGPGPAARGPLSRAPPAPPTLPAQPPDPPPRPTRAAPARGPPGRAARAAPRVAAAAAPTTGAAIEPGAARGLAGGLSRERPQRAPPSPSQLSRRSNSASIARSSPGLSSV